MSIVLTPRPPILEHLPVKGTIVKQGSPDTKIYSFDVSGYNTPATPVVTVRNETTNNDVTSTVVTLAAAINGTNFEFTIGNLSSVNLYKATMKFDTADGETITQYVLIMCES